jgi:hypothetical protein
MFILSLSLKPDKVCICNLSGKPEIWVSQGLIIKNKDLLLQYLRKKLNDNTITTIMMDTYMIIRHPNRMKYIELRKIPDKFPDDHILFDDLYFVLELMAALVRGNGNIYRMNEYIISLYKLISGRIKSDTEILYNYLILGIDTNNIRFYTIPDNIINDKEVIVKLIRYSNIHTDGNLHFSTDIYRRLSDPMRHDIDIIKSVLSGTYSDDCMCDQSNFTDAAPSYVFDFSFIIENFDNICVILIYIWMDIWIDDKKRFNYIDISGRLILLKMAIKYTTISYESNIRSSFLSNIYEVTQNYVDYYYESTESSTESDNEALEEILDILDSRYI